MKHTKFMRMAAAAAALLLTACAQDSAVKQRDTDLSARYSEFMEYCFGDDYTFEYVPDQEDHEFDDYRLTYRDHTGTLHTVQNTMTAIQPYKEYKKEENEPAFADADEYYSSILVTLVEDTLQTVISREFRETVIKPEFSDVDAQQMVSELPDGAEYVGAVVQMLPFDASSHPNDPQYEVLYNLTQPGKGYQLCKADLSSTLNSDLWYVVSRMKVPKGKDPAPYVEKMKAAYKRFLEMTDHPQTYFFAVSLVDDEMSETVWKAQAMLGEVITVGTEEYCKGTDALSSVSAARVRLREKYGLNY
ncbi:MAG: hypothetical protein IK130_10310 [Oscillospiraceae bacterium]|nr:hypothetical protein [Oscillospiraceae bacterium]